MRTPTASRTAGWRYREGKKKGKKKKGGERKNRNGKTPVSRGHIYDRGHLVITKVEGKKRRGRGRKGWKSTFSLALEANWIDRYRVVRRDVIFRTFTRKEEGEKKRKGEKRGSFFLLPRTLAIAPVPSQIDQWKKKGEGSRRPIRNTQFDSYGTLTELGEGEKKRGGGSGNRAPPLLLTGCPRLLPAQPLSD